MIPKKNLFSGGLGKTRKPGGAPFMTIPHTRTLNEPSYVIDEPIPGEFVCCSLNGRLWLYKTTDSAGIEKLVFFTLRWNETTGRMEFVDDGSGIFAIPANRPGEFPEAVVARGIDWILTSFFIVQVNKTAPYIQSKSVILRGTPGTIGGNMDFNFNYSIQRAMFRRGRINNIPVGCGIDPFTHNQYGTDEPLSGPRDGYGYFSTRLGGIGLYPRGTHTMESCYATLPSVGDWIIIEDFLIRRPSNPIDVGSNKFHAFLYQARPLIPLEFNWYADNDDTMPSWPTYGTGFSATRRGIQLTASGGCLWGRGLMYMGQAFILPAAFGEEGEPEEFFLYISNSHKCAGPYNQFNDPNLNENVPWMSIAAAALKDTAGGADGQIVGFMSEKGDPVAGSLCQSPKTGEVLLPKASDGGLHGTWKLPRPGDESRVIFDPAWRMGLALGEKGVTLFEGDAEHNDLAVLGDYWCPALPKWLTPADSVESVSEDAVVASDDNGVLVTNMGGHLDRIRLPKRLLPLAWGVFEKKDANTGDVTDRLRLSFGVKTEVVDVGGGEMQEASMLTINELSCPDELKAPVENIPWESVYRNPFDIRILRAENGTSAAHEYRAGWFQRNQPYNSMNSRQEYAPPCIPILYRSVAGGRVEFAYVHPDTAELVPETYDFGNVVLKMFPVLGPGGTVGAEDADGNFIPMNLNLPAWLSGGDDWRNLSSYYSMPNENARGVPGLYLGSRLLMFPSITRGPWKYSNGPVFDYGYPHALFFSFQESSTNVTVNLRHSAAGGAEGGNPTGVFGDMLSNPKTILGGDKQDDRAIQIFCHTPVRDYRGRNKYLKNLFILGMRNGDPIPITHYYPRAPTGDLGYWREDRWFIVRADLNNDIFDFDEELKRSKVFIPQP